MFTQGILKYYSVALAKGSLKQFIKNEKYRLSELYEDDDSEDDSSENKEKVAEASNSNEAKSNAKSYLGYVFKIIGVYLLIAIVILMVIKLSLIHI